MEEGANMPTPIIGLGPIGVGSIAPPVGMTKLQVLSHSRLVSKSTVHIGIEAVQ